MTSKLWTSTLLLGCAAALTISCADDTQIANDDDPGLTAATIDSAAAVDLSTVPPTLTRIAEALLNSASGSEATPSWTSESTLENTAYVYHRPGVEGPAYYEFGVSSGGSILVSTGRHDVPVPAFGDTGEPAAVHVLAASARPVALLYRLSSHLTLATDTRGVIVSSDAGEQKRTLKEYLSTLESDSTPKGLPAAEEQALFDEQWEMLYASTEKKTGEVGTEGSPSVAVTSVKWLYHRELLTERIRWGQHDVDPSSKVCFSGCGPVALGQVSAYLAYSDRWGNPRYAGSGVRNLYANVSTAKDSSGAKAVVETLHHYLGSICWPDILRGQTLADLLYGMNQESAVAPWNMDRYVDWAKGKGAKVRFTTSYGGPSGGDESAAWTALRAGNPVVFGWKFTHYNVGAGTAYLNGVKYIWVNNGWGGTSDGWLRYDKSAMFFSGIVESGVDGR